MLTQKRLLAVLNYDPKSGLFKWTHGAGAGTIAGTRHDGRGFLKVSIDGERHFLHRLAWLWMTGAMPRTNVEHADGDRSNNRWANLRLGDRMQKTTHRGAGHCQVPPKSPIQNYPRIFIPLRDGG